MKINSEKSWIKAFCWKYLVSNKICIETINLFTYLHYTLFFSSVNILDLKYANIINYFIKYSLVERYTRISRGKSCAAGSLLGEIFFFWVQYQSPFFILIYKFSGHKFQMYTCKKKKKKHISNQCELVLKIWIRWRNCGSISMLNSESGSGKLLLKLC